MIADLKVTLYENLVALPLGAAALYDLDGVRVDYTNIVVTPPSHFMYRKEYALAPGRIEVPYDLEVIEQPVLYIGVARDHYGHFLLDSMSRMWAALNTELPCVLLNASSMSGPYYERIMSCLRLPLVSPIRPTLYRRIWVPNPTLTHNDIAENADSAHLRVTEELHRERVGVWGSPVYLSRFGYLSRSRKN